MTPVSFPISKQHSRLLKGVLLFFLVSIFCHSQTKGFRVEKVVQKHTYPFLAPLSPPPSELKQRFTYLDRGVQCFVFLGEDQKTILKLFKHYKGSFSTDFISRVFPHSFSRKILLPREEKMLHLLESCQIAGDLLPVQTGVFYTHLQKTAHLTGKGIIVDPLGISHTIDFDQTEFVLQKRGDPLGKHLSSLFQKGDRKGALEAMNQILLLIEQRSKLGVKKRDGNALENCGFIDGKAAELDIGSFSHREKSINPNPHKKAVQKASLELLSWVEKKFPKEAPECRNVFYHANFL